MTTKDKIITLVAVSVISASVIAGATAMAWALYIIFGH